MNRLTKIMVMAALIRDLSLKCPYESNKPAVPSQTHALGSLAFPLPERAGCPLAAGSTSDLERF